MEPYRIETNQAGRRVFIIQDFADIDSDKSFTADDFDLVYFDTGHIPYNQVRQMMSETSPIHRSRFYLKPRYMSVVNSNLYEHMDGLIDGYGVSAIDPDITVKAEGILFQIDALKACETYKTPADEEEIFRRICVYCFTREQYNFTATTIWSLASGVSKTYMAYSVINHAIGANASPDDSDMRKLVDKLLEKNYIEPAKFVERIQLCPDCHGDNLIFSECCKKCKSSDLKEEDLIHHFRCANISPESEYMSDGELICPKCKRLLRHIGLDYDRPSKVQTCNNCGAQQFNSAIKVLCANCGNIYSPSQLQRYDVFEYNFTQYGIQEILKRGL